MQFCGNAIPVIYTMLGNRVESILGYVFRVSGLYIEVYAVQFEVVALKAIR